MEKRIYVKNCGFSEVLFLSIWIQLLISCTRNGSVHANFNFYLDRREFQKLHGISTDIYYVREGVVNAYATSFLVTVPADVDDLNFSWQALTKRHVFYEMTIDYTDVFALFTPIFNISNTGRIPQKLEVFRLRLLCSGRSNAEVGVTIRIVFQIKYPKINTTSIDIKRNKICLLSDAAAPTTKTSNSREFSSDTHLTNFHFTNPRYPTSIDENLFDVNNSSVLHDQTQLLVLCGILGGCVVTGMAVVLIICICVHRELMPLGGTTATLPANHSQHDRESDPDSSYNSSPACLLRQPQTYCEPSTGATNQNWKKSGSGFISNDAEKCGDNENISTPQNVYSTIGNFWKDIFYSNFATGLPVAKQHSPERSSINPLQFTNTKGSDVSPYAYAQVALQQPQAPPLPHSAAPTFIEWHLHSPQQTKSFPVTKCTRIGQDKNDKSNIYANIFDNSTCWSNTREARSTTEYKTAIQHTPNTATVKSGTGSLIQIGGFQCRRKLSRDDNVVERFL